MFSIREVFSPPRLCIVDIGAMELTGVDDPLVRLSKQGLATLVGFEPLPEECAKLNAQEDPSRRYLPYALGDGTRRRFHVTNTGMTSSLFAPNEALISMFMNLAELMQVVRVEEIDTRRLDDIAEVVAAGCDLLKADTQGSELEIFSNAAKVMSGCLVVQTEVEFVPLYLGQPLFAEVDQLLRSRGFMFHRFLGLAGRPYRPIVADGDPNRPISQTLWGDALYVPELTRLEGLEPVALLKLTTLLHVLYQSFDLCHLVLSRYDKKTGEGFASKYLELLMRDAAQA